jgi:hypothetical protein
MTVPANRAADGQPLPAPANRAADGQPRPGPANRAADGQPRLGQPLPGQAAVPSGHAASGPARRGPAAGWRDRLAPAGMAALGPATGWRDRLTRAGMAGLAARRAPAGLAGGLMIALPALTAPAPALALTAVAALLVLASLAVRPQVLPGAGTLAAVACVLESAAWPPTTGLLAAEGLLVLGYLVLLDLPAGATMPAARRWLRGQARYGAAGLAASAVVIAALLVPVTRLPWLFLAGLAFAVAAYLLALPGRPGPPRR